MMTFEKRLRIHFKIIGSLLFAGMLFHPVLGRAEQKGATEVVQRMNSALMENMKRAQELGFGGRYKLLDPVIREVFAISYMGEKTLGSYWNTISQEQRKQYLALYTDWTISSYAGSFDGYSGEKFEIEEGEQIKGNAVTVISNLVIPHENSVEFNYTLRRSQDKWRIVDIRTSGVSQLSLTRSQFISVMKSKGFDGLMAALKEKIAGYHARDKQVEK